MGEPPAHIQLLCGGSHEHRAKHLTKEAAVTELMKSARAPKRDTTVEEGIADT